MGISTYDPKYIAMSYLGQLIQGFQDGTFIEAERLNDAFTDYCGAGGEVVRARNNDIRGTVTFTLHMASPYNDYLSAAEQLDELTGVGLGPLFVKDLLGTTLIISSNSWIVKPTKVEFGKEVGSRVWTIRCAQLEIYAGGLSTVIVD